MHQAFPRLSKTPGKIRHSAPSLGGDTDLVLKRLEYQKTDTDAKEKQNY